MAFRPLRKLNKNPGPHKLYFTAGFWNSKKVLRIDLHAAQWAKGYVPCSSGPTESRGRSIIVDNNNNGEKLIFCESEGMRH